MICHGSVRNAQGGNVSFAISDMAKSGNPNAQANAMLSTCMPPMPIMILAIPILFYSAFVRPVMDAMTITIVSDNNGSL